MVANEIDIKKITGKNIIPIIFILMTALMIPYSGFSGRVLVQEIIFRLSSNTVLVLALLIPLIAGMGVNFGLGLGVMACQIALILVTDWHITGILGMILAMLISTPISLLFGFFGGCILKNAKGMEMIISWVLGIFMLGVYQIIVSFGMGKVIPIGDKTILLPRGFGIRNSIQLDGIRGSFDTLIDKLLGFRIQIAGIVIPVFTFLVVAALCLWIWWFRRTKLGQKIRAVGKDMDAAAASGINVGRIRIISILISTVLAGYGYAIYIQNIGVMPVYTGANSVVLFAAAALLFGGNTADKAGLPRVIVGVVLFNLFFIVTPMAAKRILVPSEVDNFFIGFFTYLIVAVAFAINARNNKKEKE
ncbi:MAG: ABC transporter permease [Firmicutes bacterium]|nr:ABC transporter permease [Bacillota bacterium]